MIKQHTFIDTFAGSGGISVGLLKAGWKGLCAIERDQDAFNTLKTNLISRTLIDTDLSSLNQDKMRSNRRYYNWAKDIPLKPWDIKEFIKFLVKNKKIRETLTDNVDLLAGGPPCQGFSIAGKRIKDDPRNQLILDYIKLVKLIKPKLLLIENVQGITSSNSSFINDKSYLEVLTNELNNSNKVKTSWDIYHQILNAKEFGVPQNRKRVIIIGIRNDIEFEGNPFDRLEEFRLEFLNNNKLTQNVTVSDAISDLLSRPGNKRPRKWKGNIRGFREIPYDRKNSNTSYQKMLGVDCNEPNPNSLRLARHSAKIKYKFKVFIRKTIPGNKVEQKLMEKYGTKKKTVIVLNPKGQSPTLTTLPDDYLHYSEPRILTVREMARLMSFPDWYRFTGKYTTGGLRRSGGITRIVDKPKHITGECPRYTQVGNAVAPFVSETLGMMLKSILD